MSQDSGYGPYFTRRGRGNVLTHFLMLVVGAGLAAVLLLAFGVAIQLGHFHAGRRRRTFPGWLRRPPGRQ